MCHHQSQGRQVRKEQKAFDPVGMRDELMATRRARVPAVCHLINVSAMFLSLILAFLTELFWRRGLSVDSWAASTKKIFCHSNALSDTIAQKHRIKEQILKKKYSRCIWIKLPKASGQTHHWKPLFFCFHSEQNVCVSLIQLVVTYTWPCQIHRQGFSGRVNACHLLTCRCWHKHLTCR